MARSNGARVLRGYARVLKASNLHCGALRARGVPAILLGSASIVLAAGAARALALAAPAVADVLREATALVEAMRGDAARRRLNG